MLRHGGRKKLVYSPALVRCFARGRIGLPQSSKLHNLIGGVNTNESIRNTKTNSIHPF